jgi:hypothetical protein
MAVFSMKIVKERQVQNKYQHSYQQVVDKLCIFSTCGGLRMNVKGDGVGDVNLVCWKLFCGCMVFAAL